MSGLSASQSARIQGLPLYRSAPLGYWRLDGRAAKPANSVIHFLPYTIAPKEGDNLGASTVGIWAEGDGTGTGGDSFAGRPNHGLCIVSARRHIREATAGGRRRRPGVAPQEGDSLSAGYYSIRAEGRSAGAGCNVLLHSPEHGLIVVGSRIHIGEGSTALCGFGEPAARQRKVTICARVQEASGLNVVAEVPPVIPCSTAHCTASAYRHQPQRQ